MVAGTASLSAGGGRACTPAPNGAPSQPACAPTPAWPHCVSARDRHLHTESHETRTAGLAACLLQEGDPLLLTQARQLSLPQRLRTASGDGRGRGEGRGARRQGNFRGHSAHDRVPRDMRGDLPPFPCSSSSGWPCCACCVAATRQRHDASQKLKWLGTRAGMRAAPPAPSPPARRVLGWHLVARQAALLQLRRAAYFPRLRLGLRCIRAQDPSVARAQRAERVLNYDAGCCAPLAATGAGEHRAREVAGHGASDAEEAKRGAPLRLARVCHVTTSQRAGRTPG